MWFLRCPILRGNERALLASQSRRIEWRGGGRNVLTQRQKARGSSHKPGGDGHRKRTVFYSRQCVRCPGDSLLPRTVTPWFPRLWLCYETCESTRPEQTWDVIAHSHCQLLREIKSEGVFIQKDISIIWFFDFFLGTACILSTLCLTPCKWKYDCVLSSYMRGTVNLLFNTAEVWHLPKSLKLQFVFAV